MREKRIAREREALLALNDSSPFIEIVPTDVYGTSYLVTYRIKGLCLLHGANTPTITNLHKMEIYLHERFPRFPPKLVWLTDIFHPNILSYRQNGAVCIGGWSPAETVSKLVLRIGEMVQYKNYNPKDPLNKQAANWVIGNERMFPICSINLYEQVKESLR